MGECILELDTTGSSPLQSLDVFANIDPMLTYALGFINPFASTTSFVLTLLVPYVGGPYDQITLSHASTVTDGGNSGGATIGLNTEAHVANALLDGAVTTGLSLGCTITAPPSSQTCFSGADSTVGVSSAATGIFGLRLSFTLSANDAYSTTGTVVLDNARNVPEPATSLLLASGLMGLLWRRLR